MVTEYYCKNCDTYFTEEALPNMHRLHRCGAVARIVSHASHAEKSKN